MLQEDKVNVSVEASSFCPVCRVPTSACSDFTNSQDALASALKILEAEGKSLLDKLSLA